MLDRSLNLSYYSCYSNLMGKLMIPPSFHSLGFVVQRLSNFLKAELERGFAARGHDVTADQWLVLVRLYEEDGLAQHELGKRIARDKTNVTRILTLMETRRLIERQVDSNDTRSRKIYLTEYGLSLETDLKQAASEVMMRAQQGFNKQEIDFLINSLDAIYKNLS